MRLWIVITEPPFWNHLRLAAAVSNYFRGSHRNDHNDKWYYWNATTYEYLMFYFPDQLRQCLSHLDVIISQNSFFSLIVCCLFVLIAHLHLIDYPGFIHTTYNYHCHHWCMHVCIFVYCTIMLTNRNKLHMESNDKNEEVIIMTKI